MLIVVKCKINFRSIEYPRKLLAIHIIISISRIAIEAFAKIFLHVVTITIFISRFATEASLKISQ